MPSRLKPGLCPNSLAIHEIGQLGGHPIEAVFVLGPGEQEGFEGNIEALPSRQQAPDVVLGERVGVFSTSEDAMELPAGQPEEPSDVLESHRNDRPRERGNRSVILGVPKRDLDGRVSAHGDAGDAPIPHARKHPVETLDLAGQIAGNRVFEHPRSVVEIRVPGTVPFGRNDDEFGQSGIGHLKREPLGDSLAFERSEIAEDVMQKIKHRIRPCRRSVGRRKQNRILLRER